MTAPFYIRASLDPRKNGIGDERPAPAPDDRDGVLGADLRFAPRGHRGLEPPATQGHRPASGVRSGRGEFAPARVRAAKISSRPSSRKRR